jgi:hypothetical protein
MEELLLQTIGKLAFSLHKRQGSSGGPGTRAVTMMPGNVRAFLLLLIKTMTPFSIALNQKRGKLFVTALVCLG